MKFSCLRLVQTIPLNQSQALNFGNDTGNLKFFVKFGRL